MTTQTPCQYSQQLLWHFVSIAMLRHVFCKYLPKLFLQVHMSPQYNFFYKKKDQKACETVSLSLKSETIKRLKGAVSRDFGPFFSLLKRFYLGPILTGTSRNGFVNFFVSAKIFDSKVWKLCVHVVNNYADPQFFCLDTEIFIFLKLLLLDMWIHPINLFSLIVPLTSVSSL